MDVNKKQNTTFIEHVNGAVAKHGIVVLK